MERRSIDIPQPTVVAAVEWKRLIKVSGWELSARLPRVSIVAVMAACRGVWLRAVSGVGLASGSAPCVQETVTVDFAADDNIGQTCWYILVKYDFQCEYLLFQIYESSFV